MGFESRKREDFANQVESGYRGLNIQAEEFDIIYW